MSNATQQMLKTLYLLEVKVKPKKIKTVTQITEQELKQYIQLSKS